MRKLFSKSLIAAAVLATACSPIFAMAPLTAKAWLVADGDGKVLEGTHTTDIRSIASITKLMTVMVVLDAGQPLLETISKKLYNRNLTRLNLIELALIKSDNNAAKMLCEFYPSGIQGCIDAMNNKAFALGMYDSKFTDPTGLYDTNVSTAEDLVKLVMTASTYTTINQASNKDKVIIPAKKNQTVFNNTNKLVGKGYEFLVSKTGWITKSGGCIVMMLDTVNGVRTVVLLGSRNTKTRIPEAEKLALLTL